MNNAYLFNWFFQETQAYNRQQKCRHLKGMIGGPRASTRDYNIAMHTFPDGYTKIWCLSNCGWNVWNKLGWSFKWAVGMKMINNSTNKGSSSEINSKVLVGKTPVIPGPTSHTGGYIVYKDRT